MSEIAPQLPPDIEALHALVATARAERDAAIAERDHALSVDGIALIPIEGTLVHKGAYVGAYSGRTSYEGLQAQVLRAMRNPAIKGVVFEVDSFAGELAGAFETADLIARLSTEKPTLAILTDHALSAGYLLASAARQIIIQNTGAPGQSV